MSWPTKQVTLKRFSRVSTSAQLLTLNVRHVADHAAFRIDQAGQDHRDGDQFADLALTVFNKLRDGIEQRMLQRLLGAFRKRIVFFRNGFTAQIIQREGGVVAAETDPDGLEMAGFGHDGDGAAAAGGGLLIDFFDQPALNQLAGNFGHAGGSKLALFGNLNARDGALLVNQAVNRRAVKLFDEVNVTDLSLSARCSSILLLAVQ